LPEWGSLETVSFLAVTDTSFVRRRSVLGTSADAGLNGEPARETPFENAFKSDTTKIRVWLRVRKNNLEASYNCYFMYLTLNLIGALLFAD
jgi:hypothetical protein